MKFSKDVIKQKDDDLQEWCTVWKYRKFPLTFLRETNYNPKVSKFKTAENIEIAFPTLVDLT